MGKPVVHWEIGGKDARKLQEFYAKLFAWEINTNYPWNCGKTDTGGDGGINGSIGPTGENN